MLKMSRKIVRGLCEKTRSCSLNISRAISGDEMTSVAFAPNLKSMMGPYLLANCAKD